ncbi:MAG: LamG-like jellyroll fold domain-containing protein, partial [Thermoguttaceae bacterium]
MTRCTILAAWVLAWCGAAGLPADGAQDAAASPIPKPLRLYTFETLATERPVAESSGAETAPLAYTGTDKLALVPGRSADRKAVRLDDGTFKAKPIAPSPRGCTVEIWLRKDGQGKQLGNGRTTGMIFSVGNGYWEGMRLSTSYPDQRLSFEIGRPQPSNAVSTQTELPVPDAVWQHVAVTWDRSKMRIYWNGLPVATADYRGEWTDAAELRLGYADSGIGSLNIDVDEF